MNGYLTVLPAAGKGKRWSRSVGTRFFRLLSSLKGFLLSQQVDKASLFFLQGPVAWILRDGKGRLHG
jgi:hypothetical protein